MVNVVIAADSRYKFNKDVITTAVSNVLQRNNVRSQVEIEVNIVGDRKMHELNKKYRNMDYIPEVLTFALEDPNPQNMQLIPNLGFVAAPDQVLRLGSILISYPQAVEDASLDGKSVEDEISFLVEHGTNHLLGIHH
jgi:probable rRNA maturation factor